MHLQDGDVHQALKDLVVANDAMRRIMEADPSVGNRNFYGITCLNLGSVYQMMQDFESFRDCARTGTNYLEGVLEEQVGLETLFYLASVYLQLGQADEIEENYESAEAWYKKAIERQIQVTEQDLDPEASQYAKQTLSQEFLILTGLYQKMQYEEKYLETLEHTVELKIAIAQEFDHPYDWADAAMGEETLASVIAQKEPARAEQLFRDAVAILEKQTETEEDIGDVLIQPEVEHQFGLGLVGADDRWSGVDVCVLDDLCTEPVERDVLLIQQKRTPAVLIAGGTLPRDVFKDVGIAVACPVVVADKAVLDDVRPVITGGELSAAGRYGAEIGIELPDSGGRVKPGAL